MHQYKLYNSVEIEKLKQDMEVYKQTLETMKSSNSLDKFLQLQRELYELRLKFSKFKGEMKAMEENYQEKIVGYERQDQKNSTKIQTINDSLNQLKQDVTSIKGEIEEMPVTELLQKMNLVINRSDDNLTTVKNQINTQKEELLQSKEHIKPNAPKKPIPQPSEYKRLQNMLQSFNNANQSNSITTNKTIRQLPSSNQNSVQNRPLGDSRIPISLSKETKAVRSFPNEFNKNIITRTSKPKNTGKLNRATNKEESPSMIKNYDNSPAVNDHPIEGKIENSTEIEENQKEMNAEAHIDQEATMEDFHSDLEVNKQYSEQEVNVEHNSDEEVTHLHEADSTLDLANEKSDEEMVAVNNDEIPEAETRLNRSSKKKELSSFFSFFRKS